MSCDCSSFSPAPAPARTCARAFLLLLLLLRFCLSSLYCCLLACSAHFCHWRFFWHVTRFNNSPPGYTSLHRSADKVSLAWPLACCLLLLQLLVLLLLVLLPSCGSRHLCLTTEPGRQCPLTSDMSSLCSNLKLIFCFFCNLQHTTSSHSFTTSRLELKLSTILERLH